MKHLCLAGSKDSFYNKLPTPIKILPYSYIPSVTMAGILKILFSIYFPHYPEISSKFAYHQLPIFRMLNL
jgi:hypothetical protein